MEEPKTAKKEDKTETTPKKPQELSTANKRVFNPMMSTTIGKLAEALSAAQGAMENGIKDKQGYGYKYMTLGNLTDIARKPLADNNLSIIQSHELIKSATNPSVVTHTTVMHSSGEWFTNSLELPIHNMQQLSAAQMIGVCATYGRRYALQSICLIAADDDTDGVSK